MTLNGALIIEGHIQGLSNVRALGEIGVPVYVVDCTRCLAQYSKYCTKSFRCPPFLSDEFIPFLIQLGQAEGLHKWLIMASNDHIVEQLSKHKEELAPYYTLVVPDYSNLTKILNKQTLAKTASLVGTHVPAFCNSKNIQFAQKFRFPVLVKGQEGLSFYKKLHKKAIVVDSYEKLLCITNNIDSSVNFFIQEEIYNSQNEVISFTCFSIEGSIKSFWMGVKLREHPIRFGTATFAQSVFKPEVLAEATPLIAAISYTGICEIEFMYDERDGHYKLIEINPRTWLWVGLAKECGCNYAQMLYNYANNLSTLYPNQYAIGYKWVNLITDIPFALNAIIKRKLTIREYLSSFKGHIVHAVWDWHDILPGLVLPVLMLHIYKHRK